MVDETAPATPPPEPKMELEEDVVVECLAPPRLEESRPIVRQRLALDDMVDRANFSRLEQRTCVLVLEMKMPTRPFLKTCLEHIALPERVESRSGITS